MPSEKADGMRARLFDADNHDRLIDPGEIRDLARGERQLLWIDSTRNVAADGWDWLPRDLQLTSRTRAALQGRFSHPLVALYGTYLHVRVAADPSDRNPDDTVWLDIVAGPNVVLTFRGRPIPFLDDLDQRIRRDVASGILSSAAFLTVIVDAAITSYHRAVDEIEDDVDRLDAASLKGTGTNDLLADLVRCRRRIARLRGLLADHRGAFTALSAPDVAQLVDDPDSVSLLQGLNSRYEGALRAVEDSREALLGSFDVLMSRTAQRTNEVMKVLTLATVLLLPGSLIAGLLGMNVIVPLGKDDPTSFWFVVVAIAVMALAIVLAARARRWL